MVPLLILIAFLIARLFASNNTKAAYALCNETESYAHSAYPELFENADQIGIEYNCKKVIGLGVRQTRVTFTMKQKSINTYTSGEYARMPAISGGVGDFSFSGVTILSSRHGVYTFYIEVASSRKPASQNTSPVHSTPFTAADRQKYTPFDPLIPNPPNSSTKWANNGFDVNLFSVTLEPLSGEPKSNSPIVIYQRLAEPGEDMNKVCRETGTTCTNIGTGKHGNAIMLIQNQHAVMYMHTRIKEIVVDFHFNESTNVALSLSKNDALKIMQSL